MPPLEGPGPPPLAPCPLPLVAIPSRAMNVLAAHSSAMDLYSCAAGTSEASPLLVSTSLSREGQPAICPQHLVLGAVLLLLLLLMGVMELNPSLGQAHATAAEHVSWATEDGLSPVSRTAATTAVEGSPPTLAHHDVPATAFPSSSTFSSTAASLPRARSWSSNSWPTIAGAFLAFCAVSLVPLAVWGWTGGEKEVDCAPGTSKALGTAAPLICDPLRCNEDAGVDHLTYWQSVRVMVATCWPLILGNTLEWYEFSAYGFLIPELQDNFFQGSAVLAWLGFTLTFIMRPLGGLLLGWTADRCGRRIAVIASLGGMLMATIFQGCLPSHRTNPDSALLPRLGLVLIVVCRMAQGLFAGGEISGVSVILGEHETKKCLGMAAATISFGGSLAFFLSSSIVGLLHSLLTDEQMLLWGWRVPFLIALGPGLLALSSRVNMAETQAFVQASGQADEPDGSSMRHFRTTVLIVLAEYGTACRISVLGTAAIATLWYVGPIYTCNFIVKYVGVPATTALAIGSAAQLFAVALSPFVGWLTDRIGVGRVMLAGSAFIMSAGLPVYLLLVNEDVGTVTLVLAIVGVFGLAQALAGTTVFLWALELFDTPIRTTGMGITYNLAVSYFGGCAPLVASCLTERGSLLAPGAMISIAGLISTLTLIDSRRLRDEQRLQLTHLRHRPY